jgi:hypothetical protein
MNGIGLFQRKSLAVGLIVAMIALTVPFTSIAQAQSRQGALQGTVFSEGMRARVANAIVKIRNLNSQKEYISLPSDSKGLYRILGIEEGWYTLGVTTAAGDFNLNYGVYIKAGEAAKLSVEILPGGALEGKGGNGNGHKGFFGTPGGIVVIVAAAAGAGIGIYTLVKSEPEASPVR